MFCYCCLCVCVNEYFYFRLKNQLLSQTYAVTRPVFIAKLKFNRTFAWLYKTFLFGSIFSFFCGGSDFCRTVSFLYFYFAYNRSYLLRLCVQYCASCTSILYLYTYNKYSEYIHTACIPNPLKSFFSHKSYCFAAVALVVWSFACVLYRQIEIHVRGGIYASMCKNKNIHSSIIKASIVWSIADWDLRVCLYCSIRLHFASNPNKKRLVFSGYSKRFILI